MNKRELYRIAIETRNMEIGLFWQRSNYFLVLNTAIAIGFFSLGNSAYQIFLSIFGAMVSVLWFRVNLGSKYWQSRWEHRVSVLEQQIDRSIQLFSASKKLVNSDVEASLLNHKLNKKLNCYERLVLRKPSVSKSMTILALTFIGWWCVVLGFSTVAFLNAPSSSSLLNIDWPNVI
ncbi:hypothetical protein KW529_18775 [Vibrio fluvialis]|nr:hypothetical protein [Vibrio fluvialis]